MGFGFGFWGVVSESGLSIVVFIVSVGSVSEDWDCGMLRVL